MNFKLLAILLVGSISYSDDLINTVDLTNNPYNARTFSYLKNWGLDNSKKSDVDALSAWKIEEGSSKIIIAVIDTGIDFSHPDLAENQWHDPKNKRLTGWNFVTNKPNPQDQNGHGTHVAGIIGAALDPSAGISGVVHHVSIMSLKFYSSALPGSVNLKNTVKAIDYAVDHGARIINYSGGGPEFNEDEYLAIKRANQRGVLLVVAAGNEHKDINKSTNFFYPASYHLPNIVAVSASDINNRLVPSSNWGDRKVDVAAPGENIYSTLPGGKFGYMTGTSQATAFVTGIATLLLSHDPKLTPSEIKEIIVSSVDHEYGLDGKIISAGRVNAYSALKTLQKKMLAKKLKKCKDKKCQ